MDCNKMILATVVVLIPTNSKSVDFDAAKEVVRNLVGRIYEDTDALTGEDDPSNMLIYCKIFTEEEKRIVKDALYNIGILPLYLQGKTEDFGKVKNNTIIVK